MAQSKFTPPQDYVAERSRKYDAPYLNQDQQRGYNIGTLEYPEGLRTKPDLNHYVAFYINVRDKSTGGKANPQNKDYYVSEREQKRIDAVNVNKITTSAAEQGVQTLKENAGKITAGIGLLSQLATGKVPSLSGAAKIAAAALAVKGLVNLYDAIKVEEFSAGTTSRLKEVITLHVEERPSVKYGVNYSDKEMGFLTGLLTEGSAAAASGQLSGLAPEIQQRFIAELIKIPAIRNGGGNTLSDVLSLSTRTRTNPFREVLFESVDYRTFSFKYRFFPKSQMETTKIRNIIQQFKVHMHPEVTSGRLFYIYPSEFDIQYFYKDKTNDYLHKFTRFALTDMQVDYGGEQFSTFEDGSPVEIGLSLTFKELEQMTSEGIKSYGY